MKTSKNPLFPLEFQFPRSFVNSVLPNMPIFDRLHGYLSSIESVCPLRTNLGSKSSKGMFYQIKEMLLCYIANILSVRFSV